MSWRRLARWSRILSGDLNCILRRGKKMSVIPDCYAVDLAMRINRNFVCCMRNDCQLKFVELITLTWVHVFEGNWYTNKGCNSDKYLPPLSTGVFFKRIRLPCEANFSFREDPSSVSCFLSKFDGKLNKPIHSPQNWCKGSHGTLQIKILTVQTSLDTSMSRLEKKTGCGDWSTSIPR